MNRRNIWFLVNSFMIKVSLMVWMINRQENLISSVNALNYFADTYLSDDMRDSFKELIKEYERYNSKIVANHKNSTDWYSEAMANIPAPNATGVSADVRQSQERTKAYQQIGRVKHTEQEEKGLKEDYQVPF